MAKRYRYKQLNIRLSPQEYQQICDDAALMSITVGAYVRKVTLDAPVPRQSKKPSVEVRVLAKILGHIGKIGSNLNQIARNVNSYIIFDTNDLQKQLLALENTQEKLMKALSNT